MIKRNNYTGRQKILREHVSVTMREDEKGVPVFEATLDLGSYAFPIGSRVFLEAQRQTSFMRFDCGTSERITLPAAEARRLTDIVGAEGVTFRVKVVAPQEPDGGAPARLIGLAENISPKAADPGQAKSMLEVVPADLPSEIWRLEFNEDGPPFLALDRPLYAQRTTLLSAPWFRTMILPFVFRSILTRIKLVEAYDGDEDSNSWQERWLRTAQRLPGGTKAPKATDRAAVEDWIDETVAAFARRNALRERFDEYWKEEVSE